MSWRDHTLGASVAARGSGLRVGQLDLLRQRGELAHVHGLVEAAIHHLKGTP